MLENTPKKGVHPLEVWVPVSRTSAAGGMINKMAHVGL